MRKLGARPSPPYTYSLLTPPARYAFNSSIVAFTENFVAAGATHVLVLAVGVLLAAARVINLAFLFAVGRVCESGSALHNDVRELTLATEKIDYGET